MREMRTRSPPRLTAQSPNSALRPAPEEAPEAESCDASGAPLAADGREGRDGAEAGDGGETMEGGDGGLAGEGPDFA